MVEGKSEEWKILKITANGASLEPAGDIVGMKNYAACDKLRELYGEKVGIAIIGRAGEMKMCNSSVAITDPEGRPARHCARGGVGAIMGAKGLKAIVVDDTGGKLRKPVKKEAFKEAVKACAETIKQGPFFEAFHAFGTPAFIDIDNGAGSMPTRNYRAGSFEDADKINANAIHALNKERIGATGGGHACMPTCLVRCSPSFYNKDGNYVTSGFEYENLAMLGSNLGISDLDAISRMDRACDEYGFDTIEMGAALGLLAEAGFFEFGDATRAEALVHEAGEGTVLGKIIGSGVANAAKVLGIDRVPACKGQAIPAHCAQTQKGWAMAYVCSPQGADHTAGSVLEDPLSPKGQVDRSRESQINHTAQDCTGFCQFTSLEKEAELNANLINGLLGTDLSAENYVQMGKDVLKAERAFNLKAGIGENADRVPDWIRQEPLPPMNAVFDVSQEDIDDFWNF